MEIVLFISALIAVTAIVTAVLGFLMLAELKALRRETVPQIERKVDESARALDANLRAEVSAKGQDLGANLAGLRDEISRRHAETASKADQVVATFLQADQSFQAMVNTLKDVSTMAQLQQHAHQISTTLLDTHGKIDSQVATSGQIIEQLHQLVALWSKEGSELQKSYVSLARIVEEALVRDATNRAELKLQVEALLQARAKEKTP